MDSLKQAVSELVELAKPNPRRREPERGQQNEQKKAEVREKSSSGKNGVYRTNEGLVVTEDLLNFFAHFDIERRFMLIVGIEILYSQFELKVPPTLR